MALTVRLPFELYREVALRAGARNWSLSDYVTFCVAREVSGRYRMNSGHLNLPNVREAMWVEEEEWPSVDRTDVRSEVNGDE